MKKKRDPVTVRGPWIPLSTDFLCSRAWSELSLHGAKLLLDMCSGLGPNARGNGDLSAAPAVMRPKGWSSSETLDKALKELLATNLLAITRRGNRRLCTLYAVTLWPINCDVTKLEHRPGSYSTFDWEGAARHRAGTPTKDAPAKWNVLRKNANGAPATGQPPPLIAPPRDNIAVLAETFTPAAGHKGLIPPHSVTPQRDTFLDMPSAGVRIAGAAGVLGDDAPPAERIEGDMATDLTAPPGRTGSAVDASSAGNLATRPASKVATEPPRGLPTPGATRVRRHVVLPDSMLAKRPSRDTGTVVVGPWPRAVNG